MVARGAAGLSGYISRSMSDKDFNTHTVCHDCQAREYQTKERTLWKVMSVLAGDSRRREFLSALLFQNPDSLTVDA